jgi:ABC-type phosphate transport system substrate-binding protein
MLRNLFPLSAAAALLIPGLALAGEVIANPSVNLTPAEVRELFIGEKQLSGDLKLVPVDNASAQADFVAKVLQMEVPKYSTLWTKKAFREGLTAPAVKGSDAEVISFVKSTPGAVGYVGTSAAGVKVLQKY